MSKRVGAILTLVLLSVPSAATAKDKPDERVQAILSCESISVNEERLRCYDQSIVALKQALARGSMVLRERKAPLALEGVVKASGYLGSSFWVLLQNGDRWSVEPTKSRRAPPPPGMAVRLKRTLVGTYWISGPKWPESEADFLGHEQ